MVTAAASERGAGSDLALVAAAGPCRRPARERLDGGDRGRRSAPEDQGLPPGHRGRGVVQRGAERADPARCPACGAHGVNLVRRRAAGHQAAENDQLAPGSGHHHLTADGLRHVPRQQAGLRGGQATRRGRRLRRRECLLADGCPAVRPRREPGGGKGNGEQGQRGSDRTPAAAQGRNQAPPGRPSPTRQRRPGWATHPGAPGGGRGRAARTNTPARRQGNRGRERAAPPGHPAKAPHTTLRWPDPARRFSIHPPAISSSPSQGLPGRFACPVPAHARSRRLTRATRIGLQADHDSVIARQGDAACLIASGGLASASAAWRPGEGGAKRPFLPRPDDRLSAGLPTQAGHPGRHAGEPDCPEMGVEPQYTRSHRKTRLPLEGST